MSDNLKLFAVAMLCFVVATVLLLGWLHTSPLLCIGWQPEQVWETPDVNSLPKQDWRCVKWSDGRTTWR